MKFLFSSVFMLIATMAFSQSRDLKITVKGIEVQTGFLMIELLDEFENRLEAKKIEVKKGMDSVNIIFVTDAIGPFAVRLYHDENGNGSIDKNMLGIPKEKYGFSNNPRIIAGPPEHSELLFDWSAKPHVIHLK